MRKSKAAGWTCFSSSARKIRKHRFEIRRRDLACAAGNADELGASGEHFRRAALIFHDMGLQVAENRAEWRRNCTKRKRVRGSSRVDKETGDFSFEDVLEMPRGLSGQKVHAIGRSRALVRGENRREDGLTGPCGVVAREIHGIPGLRQDGCTPAHPRSTLAWWQTFLFLPGRRRFAQFSTLVKLTEICNLTFLGQRY